MNGYFPCAILSTNSMKPRPQSHSRQTWIDFGVLFYLAYINAMKRQTPGPQKSRAFNNIRLSLDFYKLSAQAQNLFYIHDQRLYLSLHLADLQQLHAPVVDAHSNL